MAVSIAERYVVMLLLFKTVNFSFFFLCGGVGGISGEEHAEKNGFRGRSHPKQLREKGGGKVT